MFRSTLGISTLLFSLSTQAAIVDLGQITRDTDTGLEWLDVTETLNLTYDEVTAQMVSGGSYEGWRFATHAEFDQLMANFGVFPVTENCQYGATFCDQSISGDTSNIAHVIELLGDTYEQYWIDTNRPPDGNGYLVGMVGESVRSPVLFDNILIIESEGAYRIVSSIGAVGPDNTLPTIGSLLVRPVPLPASGWLLFSVLAALIGKRRLLGQ